MKTAFSIKTGGDKIVRVHGQPEGCQCVVFGVLESTVGQERSNPLSAMILMYEHQIFPIPYCKIREQGRMADDALIAQRKEILAFFK